MRGRALGVVAAVVLAAIGTFVLISYARTADERALADERTVEVWVVGQPVERGTPAGELDDLITRERVPAKVQAANAVADPDELEGMVAAVDLVPGEQLVSTRFLTPDDLAEQGDVEVPEGMQTVTISLDPTRVLGGQLRAGNLVGVLASFTEAAAEGDDAEGEGAPQGESGEATRFILHKVLVTSVQGEPQPATPGDDEETEDDGRQAAPAENLLVTVALDTPQTERLVFAAEYGTIWLSHQDDTTDPDGSSIQSKETIYR